MEQYAIPLILGALGLLLLYLSHRTLKIIGGLLALVAIVLAVLYWLGTPSIFPPS